MSLAHIRTHTKHLRPGRTFYSNVTALSVCGVAFALLLTLLLTPIASAQTTCDIYGPDISVPTGYGASYNVFNTSEMMVSILCNEDQSITVTSGNNDPLTYIYNQGYRYDAGTGNWVNFTYSCSGLIADAWCVGQVSKTLTNLPTADVSFLVSYTCQWSGSKWNCGCSNSSCSTHAWQLQGWEAINADPGAIPVNTLVAGSCDDLNTKINQAQPGDHVVLASKSTTYNGCKIIVGTAASHGTPQAPITLKAEQRGQVWFTGDSTTLVVTRDHWNIQDFVWENIDARPQAAIRFEGASYTNFRNNLVKNCTANYDRSGRFIQYSNSTSAGRYAKYNIIERNEFTGPSSRPVNGYFLILLAQDQTNNVTDTTIRYNYVHDMVVNNVFNFGANGAWDIPTNHVLENNLLVNVKGESLHIKSSQNHIRNNTVRGAEGLGTRVGSNNTFFGNYLFDIQVCDLNVSTCSNRYGFGGFGPNHIIRHNYMEGGNGGVSLGWGEKVFSTNTSLWNSLARANTSWPTTNATIANNTFVDGVFISRNNTSTFRPPTFRLREWLDSSGTVVAVADIPPTNNVFTKNIVFHTDSNSKLPAVEMLDAKQQAWSQNHVWPNTIPLGDSLSGVTNTLNLLMKKNSYGVWISQYAGAVLGARPPCRPLTSADVGPGSTYKGCSATSASYNP